MAFHDRPLKKSMPVVVGTFALIRVLLVFVVVGAVICWAVRDSHQTPRATVAAVVPPISSQ